MLSQDVYLKNIVNSLAILKNEVSLLNAISLYDINVISEDFYAKLLNLILGYNLVNKNGVEKNAPAIDLIDEKNRVSIQVTSDNGSEKIKHTIKEFIEYNEYEKYDRLIILILTQKLRYTTSFDTEEKFSFDKKKDIWDVEDLIKKIKQLDTEKLVKINEFLAVELVDKYYRITESQANEVDTIIELIEYISAHRKKKDPMDVVIDPDYKINRRFKEFAERLKLQYMQLLTIYGSALNTVNDTLGIDEAQELIIMVYLQDISVKFLDEANDDPILALNNLVDFFEEKLSKNGKRYDRSSIKFYLVNEMIKCSVFPNERSEYDDGK